MTATHEQTPKLVQVVAFTGMNFLDFSGPLDVFLTANSIVGGPRKPYRVSVISPSGHVDMPAGMVIQTSPLTDDTEAAHTLIVSGGPGIEALCGDEAFKARLKVHSDKACRVASVCTGAFALAAIGLLDGRYATTHWLVFDELARRHPMVKVKRGPIFVTDGHVWTSAGVTAGIDLALGIVEQDLGPAVALNIAQQLVMFLRRPGDQNQFSVPLCLQLQSGRFADLHAWMIANPAEDLSVPALARRMNMSERSFVRHYSNNTGRTPGKAVEMLRLEVARHLMLHTDLSLKEITHTCGFQNEETFSRRFAKSFGISPNKHRALFR